MVVQFLRKIFFRIYNYHYLKYIFFTHLAGQSLIFKNVSIAQMTYKFVQMNYTELIDNQFINQTKNTSFRRAEHVQLGFGLIILKVHSDKREITDVPI